MSIFNIYRVFDVINMNELKYDGDKVIKDAQLA